MINLKKLRVGLGCLIAFLTAYVLGATYFMVRAIGDRELLEVLLWSGLFLFGVKELYRSTQLDVAITKDIEELGG